MIDLSTRLGVSANVIKFIIAKENELHHYQKIGLYYTLDKVTDATLRNDNNHGTSLNYLDETHEHRFMMIQHLEFRIRLMNKTKRRNVYEL